MMHQRLFSEAQQAARRGDRAAAFRLMCQTLIHDPTNVPAWLAMSQLVDDLSRQRECLERALALDPHSQPARDALEQLQQKQPPMPSAAPPRKLGARLIAQGLLT